MIAAHRTLLGWISLGLALVIFLIVRITVEQPAPEKQIIPVGDTSLLLETDRTAVWQEGDCVTLHWQIEGIRAIYWSLGPTTGTNTARWCLHRQVDIPYFTIRLPNDQEVNLPAFGFHTVRTQLIIALLPLLLACAWCFRLHLRLAGAFACLPNTFRSPFSTAGQIQPLLVALYVVLNVIVVWNVIQQPSTVAYDARRPLSKCRRIG